MELAEQLQAWQARKQQYDPDPDVKENASDDTLGEALVPSRPISGAAGTPRKPLAFSGLGRGDRI